MRLNIVEAFWRLRLVVYVGAALLVAVLAWIERPMMKPAFQECAAAVRDHIRSFDGNDARDVFPPGVDDEGFCRTVASGRGILDVPRAASVASLFLAEAEQENLALIQLKHAGKFVGWLLLMIAVAEALSRALVWVARGLSKEPG